MNKNLLKVVASFLLTFTLWKNNLSFKSERIFVLYSSSCFCFLLKKVSGKTQTTFFQVSSKNTRTHAKQDSVRKAYACILYSFSFVMFTLTSSTAGKRWLHNIHLYTSSQTFSVFPSFTKLERQVAKDDTNDDDDGNEPSLFCYIIHLVFGQSQLSQMSLLQNNLADRRCVCLQ